MMQSVVNEHGQSLGRPVRRLLWSHVMLRRCSALTASAGRAAVAWMGLIAAECLCDRWLRLGGGLRLTWLIAATGSAAGMVLWRVGQALGRKVDYVRAADSLERASGLFHEELVTLASQYMLPAPQRGAAGLLASIDESVSRRLGEVRLGKTVSWRGAAWWWMWVIAGLTLSRVLWPVAYLGERSLVMRAVMPLADVGPVTTTRLAVSASRKVVRGLPVMIAAQVGGEEQPVLHYASAGVGTGGWTETIMSATRTPGNFEVTIPSVGRDLRYYVTAGDATSDMFTVGVLTVPAVSDFAIDYIFPPYTKLPDRYVTNANGVIDAPIGSRATVTIHCTTSLVSADLIVNGASVAMKSGGSTALTTGGSTALTTGSSTALIATGRDSKAPGANDLTQWSAVVTVSGEARLALNLHGADGVLGHGPGTMAMHAIADRRPQIWMIEPTTDLELGPADQIAVRYRAADDYGVVGVDLTATVLDGARKKVTRTWALSREDKGPSAAGTAEVDLAGLNATAGDLVEFQWTGRDGAGQVAMSETARVLVSDRAVDMAARRRVAELRLADRLIVSATAALAAADSSIGDATTRVSNEAMTERTRQLLASAAESLREAEPSILRVIPTCGDVPGVPVICTGWLDDLENSWREIDATVGARGTDVGISSGRVRGLRARVDAVRREMDVVLRGELAEALLAQRADLAEATTRPAVAAAGDMGDFIAKLQADWRGGAAELGVDPEAMNVTALLAGIQNAEWELEQSKGPVDFAAAAARWSGNDGANGGGDPASLDKGNLSGRLAIAAAAEQMNTQTDWVWAWDAQLAAAAAAQIESVGTIGTARTEFSEALGDLQRERDADRSGAADVAAIREAAEESRQKMEMWSMGRPAPRIMGTANGPTSRGDWLAGSTLAQLAWAGQMESQRDWGSLAASASAAEAMGNFGWADAMDEKLTQALSATTRPVGQATADQAGKGAGASTALTPTGRDSTAGLQAAAAWETLAEDLDGMARRESRIMSRTTGGDLSVDLSREQAAVGDGIKAVAEHEAMQSGILGAADGTAARAGQIAAVSAWRRAIDAEATEDVKDARISTVVYAVDWALDGWMDRELAQWPLDVGAALAGEAADGIASGARESALAREGEVMAGLERARREAVRKSGSARLAAVGAVGVTVGPVAADAAGWGAAIGDSGRGGARQLARPSGPGPGRGGAAARDADAPDYQEAIGAYFEALGQNQTQR